MRTRLRPSTLTPLALLVLVAAGGCGTARSGLHYTGFGIADPARDQGVVMRYKEQGSLAPPSRSVVVVVDTVPAGLELKGGTLTVLPGYHHQIVGKFDLQGSLGHVFYTHYRTPWRRGYCNGQRPLVLLTLGLCGVLTPFYYPCFVDPSTKAELIADMKQLAVAAGGDLVIASYRGPTQERAAGATGFVLRMEPRMRAGQPSGGSPPASPTIGPPPSSL